jgi:hypothetical protein
MRRSAGLPKLLALAVSIVLLFSLSSAATAAGSYPAGATGMDISWPQCGGLYPNGGAFWIIGVTGGRAFTQNSCLASEFAWAQPSGNVGLYMNLNYAAGSSAGNGASGPYGACKKNTTCYAENYGWNAAHSAYAYAAQSGASASVWWLDIETANSWSNKDALNQAIIAGAIDCLLGTTPNGATCSDVPSTGIATVGIYSTHSMWQTITGGWAATNTTGSSVSPNWVATGQSTSSAASGSCSKPLWNGGSVWLAQYVSGYDWSYAC